MSRYTVSLFTPVILSINAKLLFNFLLYCVYTINAFSFYGFHCYTDSKHWEYLQQFYFEPSPLSHESFDHPGFITVLMACIKIFLMSQEEAKNAAAAINV